jgi:precorrin-8X/cobalt-precorrin-8 methylmutase
MIDYIRNPADIYRASFDIIRQETAFAGVPADCVAIATRIVHACGMPDVAAGLRFSGGFAAAARSALAAGRPIITDAEMVRQGIADKTLQVICTLNDPRGRDIGVSRGITRSAAAVELWRPHLKGSLVVIGNAPTALFALLEMIDAGGARPAAVAAFPVGFVGAAESKQELHDNSRGLDYATLLGRRGGSAMAAAVVNALTREEA